MVADHLESKKSAFIYNSERSNAKKNRGSPEGLAVHAPLVAPVVLLWTDTGTIFHANRDGHQYM